MAERSLQEKLESSELRLRGVSEEFESARQRCDQQVIIITILRYYHYQPVGKRPFPFGGRSAIVIRQDMLPHVQALLQ